MIATNGDVDITTIELRQAIEDALGELAQGSLIEGAIRLFATLGYRSERRIDLEDTSGPTFAAAFDRDGRLEQRTDLALWRSVAMLFQFGGDEIRHAGQLMMQFGEAFDQQIYRSFVFFAIELAEKPDGKAFSRAELARITREVNRLFPMPVSILFRYHEQQDEQTETRLTLAIVTHRPNRRDESRDVLESDRELHLWRGYSAGSGADRQAALLYCAAGRSAGE